MSPHTRRGIPEDAARQGLLATVIARAVRAVGRAASFAAGAAAWARQVVMPTGWVVLACGALSLVAGVALGWLELIALGCGLAFVAALGALWLVGTGASRVTLTLPTPRVSVGEHAEARIVAENPGRRRFGGVQIEVPVGDRVIERVLPALPRGGLVDERLPIPTDRRGVVTVGPARTVRADPVGIVRREIVWSDASPLHVHPRTVPISTLSTGFVRDLEGTPTRDLTASDIAFHALREYVAGDDRRHIHWRSSAKTGTFMVRQFEETRRSRLLVLLDLDHDAYTSDEEFELAVSAAASLGARALRDVRSLAFIVPGEVGERSPVRELPTVSHDRLLDAMCLVERRPRMAALPAVARAASEVLSGVSLAFLVTGSARPVTPLRAAAARLPLNVETIGIRCAPEGEAAVRQAGGMIVFGIGYLEDLQAMLARQASVA
ncbi:DUF58 domain-containing protein [Agromyces sp. CFH 90414]|uniref:DUF58 domain-containing protein n=1 Tax=Agromyces agglutinans TaxID=2662258 RepID=A0A6I2FAW3_9MICO|nr:DUF58 domain-containing protein [Agromyces agglutinans]MRG61471.1 DUF58 domain-containing protein [Agromyces agglutinans]